MPTDWNTVVTDLDTIYANRQFGTGYVNITDPLAELVLPFSEDDGSGNSTFATSPLQIMIVNMPHGWFGDDFMFYEGEFFANLSYRLQQLDDMSRRVKYFKVMIWGDLSALDSDKPSACPIIKEEEEEKLNQTFAAYESLAGNYSWLEWMGVLPNQVEASFFTPYADAWFTEGV